jgi:hypothetical protein
MDYKDVVQDIESPRLRSAGSYFSGEIALHYLDSEDSDLQNNPDEIEIELGRGMMRNPTTAKTALDMEYMEENGTGMARDSDILDIYIPALRMLRAIERENQESKDYSVDGSGFAFA